MAEEILLPLEPVHKDASVVTTTDELRTRKRRDILLERERNRRYRKENPQRNRASQSKWNSENREKYLAHKAVENAVKKGSLIRETCFCGQKAHAHHDDYSKPLDVIWLCPKHHKDRHANLVEMR